MGLPSVIRPMQFTDLESVAAIERRTFTMPWSLAIFSGQLARDTSILLVCEIDGRIVAYLIADMFVDVWHLMNLAVDTPFRRRTSPQTCSRRTSPSPSARATAGTRWR